jgi:hypothetical protein
MVEPVERLTDRDRVDARIRKRQLLRRTRERLGARDGPGELFAHLGERLDRDHACAGLDEPACQLARPCPDVGDDAPLAEREPRAEERQRLLRVARARALVELGDRAERLRDRVNPRVRRYDGVTR